MVNLFMAAFNYLIKQDKRGAQVRLSEALKITPKYVNDIVKDRRSPSQELQEKIAAYYGIRYEDFLSFGRHILAGYDPAKFELEPPRFTSPLPQKTEERMPEEFSDELEMIKFIMAQLGPSLGNMTGETKSKTAAYLLDICPDWEHKKEIQKSDIEPHGDEMLQFVRKLAWQDEEIKGPLASLGFGIARTDRDYLDWQITNKELYEMCRKEARQVKDAFNKFKKEEKTE